MVRAWGVGAAIFVDLGLVDGSLRMANGRHPVDDLFDRLDSEGVEAIPVTATDRDSDYQAAVRTVVARDDQGICIRASLDDLADATSMAGIAEVAQDLQVPLEQVDLVIDLRAIDAAQTSVLRVFLVSVVSTFPDLHRYRTFTLLSGAFPVNLSQCPQGLSLIPRSDWALWLSVRGMPLPRLPSFGDYTASHPDQEEIDPRLMRASASIRYAADTEWVIVRGRAVNSPRFGGFSQFQALSQILRAHSMFTGRSFSWSSDFIEQCANGGPTGNLTTWRKVATNRHMARVAHQIANLP